MAVHYMFHFLLNQQFKGGLQSIESARRCASHLSFAHSRLVLMPPPPPPAAVAASSSSAHPIILPKPNLTTMPLLSSPERFCLIAADASNAHRLDGKDQVWICVCGSDCVRVCVLFV